MTCRLLTVYIIKLSLTFLLLILSVLGFYKLYNTLILLVYNNKSSTSSSSSSSTRLLLLVVVVVVRASGSHQ